jgi:hypothetical protein
LVRAELKRLRQEQLVSEQLLRTTVAWQLTEKGIELAAAADQRDSDESGSPETPKIEPPPT